MAQTADGTGDDDIAPIQVKTVDEVPWSDVEAVFGSTGDQAACWCQFFKQPNAEWRTLSAAERKARLRAQVTASAAHAASVSPGLVAYSSGEPVGWCGVEPRSAYPRLQTSRVARAGRDVDLGDKSVWSITCFVVKVGHRGNGIAQELLAAAVVHALSHGAASIEGYPIDTAERPRASAADLYHGTRGMFEAAGFGEIAASSPARPVMRFTPPSSRPLATP